MKKGLCGAIILKIWCAAVSISFPMHAEITPIFYHGDILKRSEDVLPKNGILEEIQLYPLEYMDSSNRITRRAQFAIYPHAYATVLVCHGFMCDKDDTALFRGVFSPGKHNVLNFDFRAHGDFTDGQSCTFGKEEINEIITAVEFIRSHPNKTIAQLPIIAYGFSMGAATAILAQVEQQQQGKQLFDALILDCPYDSTEQVLKRCISEAKIKLFGYEMNIPGSSFLERHAFHPYVQESIKQLLKTASQLEGKDIPIIIHPISPELAAKKLSIPCLFIHCKNDQRVPTDAVMRVYNNTPGFKRFWLTDGRRHFDSFFSNPEGYSKVVRNFVDCVAKKELNRELSEKIIKDIEPGQVINQLSLNNTYQITHEEQK